MRYQLRGNLKLDESCISNPKSEIANWTGPIRYFGFEMQDSSNFKFSSFAYVGGVRGFIH